MPMNLSQIALGAGVALAVVLAVSTMQSADTGPPVEEIEISKPAPPVASRSFEAPPARPSDMATPGTPGKAGVSDADKLGRAVARSLGTRPPASPAPRAERPGAAERPEGAREHDRAPAKKKAAARQDRDAPRASQRRPARKPSPHKPKGPAKRPRAHRR